MKSPSRWQSEPLTHLQMHGDLVSLCLEKTQPGEFSAPRKAVDEWPSKGADKAEGCGAYSEQRSERHWTLAA